MCQRDRGGKRLAAERRLVQAAPPLEWPNAAQPRDIWGDCITVRHAVTAFSAAEPPGIRELRQLLKTIESAGGTGG